MPLSIQIVTPEREVVVAEDVTFVVAQGIEGNVGVLPGHAPLLIALGTGPLEMQRPSGRERMLVDGGFLQVKDDKVIVLAEFVVLQAEIDAASVGSEIDTLRDRLKSDAENEQVRKQLLRAEAMKKLIQIG